MSLGGGIIIGTQHLHEAVVVVREISVINLAGKVIVELGRVETRAVTGFIGSTEACKLCLKHDIPWHGSVPSYGVADHASKSICYLEVVGYPGEMKE